MKKASSSFYVLFFAALLVSFQSYAQVRPQRPGQQPVPGQRPSGPERPQQPQPPVPQPIPQPIPQPVPQPIPQPIPQPQRQGTSLIQESVRQNLHQMDRLDVGMLLRLSSMEESSTQIVSLSLVAQSLVQGQVQVQLSQNGRLIDAQLVQRAPTQIVLRLPLSTLVQGLELSSNADLYIDSISAEVSELRRPVPIPREVQVQPNQLITLRLQQSVRGSALIDIDQIARQQLGMTLRGAEIQRVIVMGQPAMMGRSASVQVQLNGRPASESKFLVNAAARVPLLVQSLEEARDLDLVVMGDADILEISVRVGNVRPQGPIGPSLPQRISVNQEISYRMPLELSRLIALSTPIVSLTIEARASRSLQGQVSLISRMNEVLGTMVVSSNVSRGVIQLRRPMMASELRLESMEGVIIQAIEIQSDLRIR